MIFLYQISHNNLDASLDLFQPTLTILALEAITLNSYTSSHDVKYTADIFSSPAELSITGIIYPHILLMLLQPTLKNLLDKCYCDRQFIV